MVEWTMKTLLGLAVAAGIAPLLPTASLAQGGCLNAASTCSSARVQCYEIRRRVGRNSEDCEPAFKRCMRDGSWFTQACNRSGLKKV
jgi:hypothetical protein